MNWQNLFSINITDSYALSVEIGPVFMGGALLAFVVYKVYCHRFKNQQNWDIVEAEVSLGGIGKIKIKPGYEDVQIAHSAWTELVTRKAALLVDEEHDLIIEVYNSWYALFQEMRRLIKSIPASQIRRSSNTQELVRLLVQALNEGLRPHLTEWQAKFRSWYEDAIKQYPSKTPQEIQREYPYFDSLIKDLLKVNKDLMAYSIVIKKIAHGPIFR